MQVACVCKSISVYMLLNGVEFEIHFLGVFFSLLFRKWNNTGKENFDP